MRPLMGSVMMAAFCAGLVVSAGSAPISAQEKKAATKTQGKSDAKDAPAATAVFEMYKDKGGKYRFRFMVNDENVAMAPHGYDSKEDCQKVIDAIQKGAAKAKIDDQSGKKDKSGKTGKGGKQ